LSLRFSTHTAIVRESHSDVMSVYQLLIGGSQADTQVAQLLL
jgi:hypothetical protein